jgi:HEAT repeat protein
MRKLLALSFLALWLAGCGGSSAPPPQAANEEPETEEPKPPEQQPPGRGKPVSYWVAKLRDPDAHESREAMLELVRMGQPAVAGVIEVLKDPGEANRTRAQSTLSRIGPPAVPALVVALGDEKTSAAVVAILVKIGAEAVPALAEALENDDAKVRRSACLVLREIGEPARPAARALGKALKDNDPEVRRGAAAALARVSAPVAVAANLIEALQDPMDGELRSQAARALGKIGPGASEAIPVLIVMVAKDAQAEARASAAGALGLVIEPTELPKGAVPALRKALADSNAGVREKAAWALGALQLRAPRNTKVMPPQVIADLAQALRQEKDPKARAGMAWALGQFGESAATAIPAVAALLKDGDQATRQAAIEALALIGEPALPALADGLRSKHEDVRKAALAALAKSSGSGAEEAVPALIEALKSEDPAIRESAILILGKLGPAAKGAVPALGNLLDDPDSNLRNKAAEALGKIGKAAVPVLAKALKSNNDQVRGLAAHGLGDAGESARGVAGDLADLVADKKSSLDTRKNAAYALSKIGRGLKVPPQPLIDALQEKDDDLRGHISIALGNVGETAVPPLIDALKDLNPRVSFHVREALRRVGKPAVPALMDVAKNGKSTTIRSGAIAVLGGIGADAQEAIPTLIVLLRQDPDVRAASSGALGGIGKPAIAPLIEALDDSDARVVFSLRDALRRIGKPAVRPLIDAVTDGKTTIRVGAMGALGDIGADASPAVSALTKASAESDAAVSQAAKDALKRISAKTPKTAE